MTRLLPLLLLMAGCAIETIETGRDFPLEKVEMLEGLTIGETSLDDATSILGKPVKVEKRDDGASDVTWALLITKTKSVGLPLVTIGWGDSEITAATLRFRDDVLEEVVKTVDARTDKEGKAKEEGGVRIATWVSESTYRRLRSDAFDRHERVSVAAGRVLDRWARTEE